MSIDLRTIRKGMREREKREREGTGSKKILVFLVSANLILLQAAVCNHHTIIPVHLKVSPPILHLTHPLCLDLSTKLYTYMRIYQLKHVLTLGFPPRKKSTIQQEIFVLHTHTQAHWERCWFPVPLLTSLAPNTELIQLLCLMFVYCVLSSSSPKRRKILTIESYPLPTSSLSLGPRLFVFLFLFPLPLESLSSLLCAHNHHFCSVSL